MDLAMLQLRALGARQCMTLVAVLFCCAIASSERNVIDVGRRLLQDQDPAGNCTESTSIFTITNKPCCFPFSYPSGNSKLLYDCVTIDDKTFCPIAEQGQSGTLAECKTTEVAGNTVPSDSQSNISGFFNGETENSNAQAPSLPADAKDNLEEFYADAPAPSEMPEDAQQGFQQFFAPAPTPENEIPSDAKGPLDEFYNCKPGTDNLKTIKTKSGSTCQFPQKSQYDDRCYTECYTKYPDADQLVYDEAPEKVCANVDGTIEECEQEGDVSDGSGDQASSNTTSASQQGAPADESSSTSSDSSSAPAPSDGGSSNTLAIALGVSIPCALVAIAGLAGGIYYWNKKARPQASGFEKYEGEAAIKGGSISSKDITKPAEPVSKYATPI